MGQVHPPPFFKDYVYAGIVSYNICHGFNAEKNMFLMKKNGFYFTPQRLVRTFQGKMAYIEHSVRVRVKVRVVGYTPCQKLEFFFLWKRWGSISKNVHPPLTRTHHPHPNVRKYPCHTRGESILEPYSHTAIQKSFITKPNFLRSVVSGLAI